MDVDKASYSLVFEDFELSLQKCDFCAIDQEMTGISCVEEPQSLAMNVDDVYRIGRKIVDRYIAFQFGAALFTLLEDGNYEVKPFNFYLMKGSGDFTMNVDAINFLSSHNMDFQKWIKTGIPYYNRYEEANIVIQRTSFCSDEENTKANDVVTKIEKWFNESTEETTVLKENITLGDEKMISSRLEALHLCVFVKYSREMKYDLPTRIEISRVSSEEYKAYILHKRNCEKQSLRNALGFREFWKCLTKSKKPIIGHNFFTDLMFMIHMHEGPLSAEYENYKQEAHKLFPVIFDTKTLAYRLQDVSLFKSTSLSTVFQECLDINEKRSDPISFRFPVGYHFYGKKYLESVSKAHEAGYDAYMTGVAFTIMKVLFNESMKLNIQELENVISIYMTRFFMSLKGKDILKTKSVFAVEFDADVDIFLARSLLLDDEKLRHSDTHKGQSILDFEIETENNQEFDRVVIVNFYDDVITEECVKSRITTSFYRLQHYASEFCEETNASFTKLKNIRRLL